MPTPSPVSPSNPLLPNDLGKLIEIDNHLVKQLGWTRFVEQRRGRGDFSDLTKLRHPAKSTLLQYKNQGVPVDFSTAPWLPKHQTTALERGPHKSCEDHVDFLCEEFVDMIQKGQWVVLPFSTAQTLPGLRLSPPGVVPQRDRRPRWIGDYSWSGVNQDTAPTAPLESMQFGRALDRILHQLLVADPDLGPTYLFKADISDGFYRVNLKISDIPKLGLVFPTVPGQPPLVALPLCLPMGWTLSPPHFCAVTETIADLANRSLANPLRLPKQHVMDDRAHAVNIHTAPSSLTRPSLASRNPAIPTRSSPLAAVDVFVDDLIALAQGPLAQRRAVRSIVFQTLDSILRPLDKADNKARREVLSQKKLEKGDCSWETTKLILGWMINTIDLTITLPPHRAERLREILNSIPRHQKRTSVQKWQQLVGELRSMAIALPGARGLFSALQLALTQRPTHHRINLRKGTHDALDDFRWLHSTLTTRPTRIPELIPTAPDVVAFHDASGLQAGGVVIPTNLATRRHPHCGPLVW